MRTLNVQQGTPEWHAARASHCCASDAPAALGLSKYISHSEYVKNKALGIEREITPQEQKRFNDGHEAEAAARPNAEKILGEELYPVTAVETVDGVPLLASFDGLNLDCDSGFENKLENKELIAYIEEHKDLPDTHWPQVEHQLIVLGGGSILFTVSNRDGDILAKLSYTSKPERRARVLDAWKHTLEEIANYKHVEEEQIVEKQIDELPTLLVRVEGKVLASNLDQFETASLAFIESIKTDLETDQDFADAEKDAKFCEESEKRIALVKEQILGQTADIDAVFKSLDKIEQALKSKRLSLKKLVDTRKDSIKSQIISDAKAEVSAHVEKLNERIGRALVSTPIDGRFADAIKGKKSIVKMKEAVTATLLQTKTELSSIADQIEINVKSLYGDAHDWSFLFPDLKSVCTKSTEDFSAVLALRIKQHEDAKRSAEENKKQESTVSVAQAKPQTTAPAGVSGSVSKPDRGAIIALVCDTYGVTRATAQSWLEELFSKEVA